MFRFKLNDNGGTMKFSIVAIVLLIFWLAIPLTTATISSTDITIEVKNVTRWDLANQNVTLNIKISSSDYNPSGTNTFNITLKLNKAFSGSKVIPFLFTGTTTASNLDYFDLWNQTDIQLTSCKIQRGQFETAYNRCLSDISVYTGTNATICKDKLETCTLDLKRKDIDLTAKDDKITSIQTESDSKQNSRWVYGFGGIIAGILGLLFYQGKMGGRPKERSMSEFNPSQAG